MIDKKTLMRKLINAKDELEKLKAEFHFSHDGNAIAWCGKCGSLMQAVRPGKHQCFACEEIDKLKTENEKLNADRTLLLDAIHRWSK
jgi:hypothetical protein